MTGEHVLRLCWGAAGASLVVGVAMAAFLAPVDENMGLVQKLVYLHVPAAMVSVLAATAAFIGNIAFLWTRGRWWDDLSASAARVVVMSSLIVLLTGLVWGREYWGSWWVWGPRLTFTLILCMLYAVYLALRIVVHPWIRRAVGCAVFGAVAFLDVPLIYLSVRLIPDPHPDSIPLTAEMRYTLLPWFGFMALGAAALIATPVLRRLRAGPAPRAT